MCHYLGGGLHGRKKRVKAQSESSKSVVNSVLISREMPVFPGFLEIIRVVYKNINLNYSVGKVRLRPWAEKGGRIATNATTFNRELLIVEKDNDGKPFELHTSYEDKENYYRNLRNPWLLILLMFAIFAVVNRSVVFGVLALVSLIPVLVYQTQVMQNKREGKTKEW